MELKQERDKNASLVDLLDREQQKSHELQKKLDTQGPDQSAKVRELENTVQGKM